MTLTRYKTMSWERRVHLGRTQAPLQVRSIEHRQKREAEAEEQRRAKQAELNAQRREKAAAKRLEQDAFERQLQARATLQLYSPEPLPLACPYTQILDEHSLI